MTEKKKTGALARAGLSNKPQSSSAGDVSEKSHTRLAVVLAEKTAIVAIERATSKYSCLSRDGMETNLLKPYEDFSICGVIVALSYLSQFQKQPPQYCSSWLKDQAQEWGGECPVSNGELIIAALHLGLPIKYDSGPNATIGVRLPHAATVAEDPRTLH